MEEIRIERTDARPLKFQGEVVAEASSYRHDNNNRWTELVLYRTAGGKYVCEVRARTVWQGERDFIRAEVRDTEEDVVEYFEPSWLTQELMNEAGIDNSIEID